MGRVRLSNRFPFFEREEEARSIVSVDDYIAAMNSFVYNGSAYGLNGVQQTLNGSPEERIPNDFVGYATHGFAGNDVVFSIMAVRMLVFSAVRFQWQQLNRGRPSKMFGDEALSILEKPWPGGTTQDLLLRMIQDADLAGNSYWTEQGGQLIRLRPDWVDIVLAPRTMRQVTTTTDQNVTLGWEKIGYAYHHNGRGNGYEPALFLANEVAHFAPIPDPLATYRGMSWLTPVLRQISGDRAMSRHKQKFFENGATPNMVVSVAKEVGYENFKKFMSKMDDKYSGVENAYKTMYLGGGADVKVVGADFKQVDFSQIQGHAETRIAAAGGVPPVIVGLSEGLQAATYSNYAQARRRLADGTMHPLWCNAAGSLSVLFDKQTRPGTRLWYDARDVPFLREDEKDAAEIQGKQAMTIRTLVDAGYEADSVINAVDASDWGLLTHSGLFSVQLQPPGTEATPPTAPPPASGGNSNGGGTP